MKSPGEAATLFILSMDSQPSNSYTSDQLTDTVLMSLFGAGASAPLEMIYRSSFVLQSGHNATRVVILARIPDDCVKYQASMVVVADTRTYSISATACEENWAVYSETFKKIQESFSLENFAAPISNTGLN